MRLAALLLAAASLLPAPAPALAEPPTAEPPTADRATADPAVTLIGGWREADGSRVAAIEIDLPPGWHTYWRVPGEAGVPPAFDWTGSTNLAAVRYEWPRPAMIESYGMRSFGYEDRLVLPVLLTPRDPAAPIDVALALSFGVCNDVCMAETARIIARLSPDAAPEGRALIEAALAERARRPHEAGIARVICTLEPAAGGYDLTAEVTFEVPPSGAQVAVFESARPPLAGEAESRTDGRTLFARVPLAGAGDAGPMLERKGLRITVLDDRRAVDIRGCRAAG